MSEQRKLERGQEAIISGFEKYAADHTDTLNKGQHPHKAVIGNPVLMTGSSELGETLTYGVPGDILFDVKGGLTAPAAGFLALVGMKGIPEVTMGIGTNSDLVDLLAAYQEGGEAFLKTQSPILQDMARDYAFLLEAVREGGMAHYEEVGGFPFEGTDGEKLRQALAIEIAMRNEAAAVTLKNAPKINSVIVDPAGGRFVRFSQQDKKFVFVDPQEDSPLGRGLRILQEAKPHASSTKCAGASCSDSRTPIETLLGITTSLFARSFRTPGVFWTDETGELTDQAKQFLALAERDGVSLVAKANEATCGAMTAVWYANNDPKDVGATLPEAFKEMGRTYKGLYETVRKRGLQYYINKGIEISGNEDEAFIACLAAEQLDRDLKAAQKAFPELNIKGVYQNLPEERNYILNPQSGSFDKIPLNGAKNEPAPEPIVPAKQGYGVRVISASAAPK